MMINVKAFGVMVVLLLVFMPTVQATWWNASYPYKQEINVSVESGSTVANYEIKLVFNSSNVLSDFTWTDECISSTSARIRFTNMSENALIDHWVEKCDDSGEKMIVYVQVDQPITTDNYTVYMYYGNTTSADVSNGTNTFIVFDTFDNTVSEQWTEVDTGGQIEIDRSTDERFEYTLLGDTDAYIYKAIDMGIDTIREYTVNDTSSGINYYSAVWSSDIIDDGQGSQLQANSNGTGVGTGALRYSCHHWLNSTHYTAPVGDRIIITTGTQYWISFFHNETQQKMIVYSDADRETVFGQVSLAYLQPLNGMAYFYPFTSRNFSTADVSGWIDDVWVRNYYYPEPTWSFEADAPSTLTIAVDNPLNQTYGTLPINLNVTASESVDWCGYNLDGGSNTTLLNDSLTNWFIEMNPSSGLHQLDVYCNDTSGAMKQNNSIWFTYDNDPPDPTIFSPLNATYTQYRVSPLMTLSVDADETVDTWWYSVNGGTNTTFTPNTTFGANEGLNNITVYCNDSVGNENSTSVWFTAALSTYPDPYYEQQGIFIVNLTGSSSSPYFETYTYNENVSSSQVNFTTYGTEMMYVYLPKNITVTSATVDVEGSKYLWNMNLISNFSTNTSDGTGSQNPISLIFNNSGYYWIADHDDSNYGIYRYNTSGAPHEFKCEPSGITKGIYGMTTNSTSTITDIWIYDIGTDNITHIDAQCNVLDAFDVEVYTTLGMGLTTNNTNEAVTDLWLLDDVNDVIHHFDASGNYLDNVTLTVDAGWGLQVLSDGTFIMVSNGVPIADSAIIYHLYANGSIIDTVTFTSLPGYVRGIHTIDEVYYSVIKYTTALDGEVHNISFLYPNDVTIDVANEGNIDNTTSGDLTYSQTVDLNITAINDFLRSCAPDANNICNMTINITTDTAGLLNISNLNITYTHYNTEMSNLAKYEDHTSYYLIYWNTSYELGPDTIIHGWYNISDGSTYGYFDNISYSFSDDDDGNPYIDAPDITIQWGISEANHTISDDTLWTTSIELETTTGLKSDTVGMVDTGTETREYYANNSGGAAATSCFLSIDAAAGGPSLAPYTTFTHSNFVIPGSGSVQFNMTVNAPPAGLYDQEISLDCTGLSTSMGFSAVVSVQAPPGPGGGSTGDETIIVINETTGIGFIIGDGICNAAAGENSANSEDCRFDISENVTVLAIIIIIVLVGMYMAYLSLYDKQKHKRKKKNRTILDDLEDFRRGKK